MRVDVFTFVVAVAIALPVARGIVAALMRWAAQANARAERWRVFGLGEQPGQGR